MLQLRHRADADSLQEAGGRLFTFTRLPPTQWRSARTTNAIERPHEGFKRRIKHSYRRLILLRCCSGQINMRKVDGWQTFSHIDLAA
jgi:hypothetical protein